MLGKLMKYEWKNIWKAGTLMLLGMLVVTVIGCVVLRMPGGLVTEIADGNNMNATQSWFVLSSFVATLILYVIMLLASTWGMLIFLGIRFYRSMYTDEGYLSHTLPVTAGPHVSDHESDNPGDSGFLSGLLYRLFQGTCGRDVKESGDRSCSENADIVQRYEGEGTVDLSDEQECQPVYFG